MLAPELRDDLVFRQQLARDWRLAASLEHPNILPVLDAGEADGQAYLAMQYVEGGDLLAEMTRFGTLGPERASRSCARSRSHSTPPHEIGLVHGDVRPAHILLDGDDRAYLSGFGLSRGANFLGSYEYAAPEQLEGKPARRPHRPLRARLRALPLPRGPAAVRLGGRGHRHARAPARPAAAAVGVEPARARRAGRDRRAAMAKDPADRYQSAGEFVAAIDSALSPAEEASADTVVAVPDSGEMPEHPYA